MKHSVCRSRAAILAAVVLTAAPAAAQDFMAEGFQEQYDYETHRVRRGDTLSGLAAKHLWPLLYHINRDVVRDPHWIYPGQTLRIPDVSSLIRVEERLADRGEVLFATVGEVQFRGGDNSVRKLLAGDVIEQDGTLEVGSGSALIQLDDGTIIKVFDRSRVIFAGVLKDARGNVINRLIGIESGSAHFELPAAPGPGVRFEVRSVDARVAVNGTSFFYEVNPGVATRISSYVGSLRVSARNASLEIRAGKGVLITDGGRNAELKDLPTAPEPVQPDDVVPNLVEFEWKPASDAVRYLLQIASNRELTKPQFIGTIYEGTSFLMKLRNAGDYYWSVQSVNADGFASPPLNAKRFKIAESVEQ